MRIVDDRPSHLTGKLIEFRCAEFTDALKEIVGHQELSAASPEADNSIGINRDI